MNRRGGIPTIVAWLLALGGLGRWLLTLGSGPLATPPLDRPGRWAAWAEAVGPVSAMSALLRLACLVAVGYLLVALLVGLLARLTGRPGLLRLSDAISVALIRRILNGAVGVGVTTGALAAGATPVLHAAVEGATGADHHLVMAMARSGGLVTGTVPAVQAPLMRPAGVPAANATTGPTMRTAPTEGTADSPAAGPTMRTAPPESSVDTAPSSPPPPSMRPEQPATVEPSGMPTMRPAPPLDDVGPPIMRPDQHRGASSAVVEEPIGAPGSPPPTTVHPLGADPPPAGPASPPTDAVPAAGSAGPAHPASVVLERGDHLWAVAERHLAARLDHEPDDAEITAYWQRLITLNVAELADPANPDLVFSGQVIRLPPL